MRPGIAEANKTIRRFQRWVYHEVLPSIRDTGGYVAGGDFGEVVKAITALIDEKGMTWWVASDVCKILELSNTSIAVNGQTKRTFGGTTYQKGGLPDNEKRDISLADVTGRMQKTICINEAGLLELD